MHIEAPPLLLASEAADAAALIPPPRRLCSWHTVPDLESILRDPLRKIFLQQYRPKADTSSAANVFSNYPFFAGREGRSPSVPILSEVDTRTHILNKDMAKHMVLVGSASSVQTHRKPKVDFRQTDLRS
jgi:hypothetical protein